MDQGNQLIEQDLKSIQDTTVSKGKCDLIVLRYMARRLHLTLHQLGDPIIMSKLQLYQLQERFERTHRIAIYRYRELLSKKHLAFVGFISQKQRNLSPSIIGAIKKADKQLVKELSSAPGILSYSSLELRNGNWCNLVLLSDASTKAHIKDAETHTYAAYHLAPHYYEWIRLHNGMMAQGLDHTEMYLQKTKYYSFSPVQLRPTIQELTYGLATNVEFSLFR